MSNTPQFVESDFYDYSRILSYNKTFMFVIGARGIGKTYGAKRYVINRFFKSNEQFIYLRRYMTEHEGIKGFFNDIQSEFPDHKFEVKHKAFYIDGRVAGYYLALNTSAGKKSITEYNKIGTIVFDEFIVEHSGGRGYIKDEVTAWAGIFETIARIRPVKCLFLSNSVSQVNPYFVYWNIHLVHGQKFWNNNPDIVVERCDSTAFSLKKKNTPFGRLFSGTQIGAYMFDNSWLDDSDTFIEQMSGDCKPICEIAYMGSKYFVWVRTVDNIVFFTNKSRCPDGTVKLSLTTDDHNIDYKFVRSPHSSSVLETLYSIYTSGDVRFNNLVSKQAFVDIMQLV